MNLNKNKDLHTKRKKNVYISATWTCFSRHFMDEDISWTYITSRQLLQRRTFMWRYIQIKLIHRRKEKFWGAGIFLLYKLPSRVVMKSPRLQWSLFILRIKILNFLKSHYHHQLDRPRTGPGLSGYRIWLYNHIL